MSLESKHIEEQTTAKKFISWAGYRQNTLIRKDRIRSDILATRNTCRRLASYSRRNDKPSFEEEKRVIINGRFKIEHRLKTPYLK